MFIMTVILFSFITCEGPQGSHDSQEEDGHIHDYDNGICRECCSIEMVQISAGTFIMGQEGATNMERDVTLSAFIMSK